MHLPRSDADRDVRELAIVDDEVDEEGDDLSDAGRPGGTGDAHGRDRTEAEDHDRVEDDVDETADQHADHRNLHAADGLEHLLIGDGGGIRHTEKEDDTCILGAQADDVSIIRKPSHEGRHPEDAEHADEEAVEDVAEEAEGRRGVRLLLEAGTERVRDHGVHADAEAHRHRDEQILRRVDEGQRGHRLLADARDVVAVDDVVERVHEHGNRHRNRHGNHERHDRTLLHKCLVHFLSFNS